jgi:cullin 3
MKAYYDTDENRDKQKQRYEISMNPLQAMIVLLFNSHQALTLDEIARLLGLDVKNAPDHRKELVRHLQSLACAKYKILRKHSKGIAVQNEDQFDVNRGFSSPQLRIKIPMIALRTEDEISENDKENRQKISEERSHLTNAAIVRIMKSRRTLDHHQLVIEASKQLSLRFTPDPLLIKRQIEHLIDKEYLGRDSTDRRLYHYIA